MFQIGGANRDRTDDLYNAIVALSQLSYSPNLDLGQPSVFNEVLLVENLKISLKRLRILWTKPEAVNSFPARSFD